MIPNLYWTNSLNVDLCICDFEFRWFLCVHPSFMILNECAFNKSLHFLRLSFLSNPDRIIVLPWHFKYSLSQYTLSKLLYVILKAVFAGLAKVREAPEKKQREKKLPKLVCWRGGEVSAILAVLGQLDRYMKKMISRTLVMLTLSDPAYFWPFKTWQWGA